MQNSGISFKGKFSNPQSLEPILNPYKKRAVNDLLNRAAGTFPPDIDIVIAGKNPPELLPIQRQEKGYNRGIYSLPIDFSTPLQSIKERINAFLEIYGGEPLPELREPFRNLKLIK